MTNKADMEDVERFLVKHPMRFFTIKKIAEYLDADEDSVRLAVDLLLFIEMAEIEYRYVGGRAVFTVKGEPSSEERYCGWCKFGAQSMNQVPCISCFNDPKHPNYVSNEKV